MIRFVDMRQLTVDADQAPERYEWAFVGAAIDERGRRSLALVRNSAAHTAEVEYDPDSFMLRVGEQHFRVSDLEGISQAFPGNPVLDATSLDPVEILILTAAFMRDLAGRRLGFVYTEPARYRPSGNAAGMDIAFNFALRFRGMKSVPGFAGELREDENGRLVACLGFEPERLDRILQDDEGTFIKHITLVFGVPPYRTSWEMHALLPHERIIRQNHTCELSFAGANNPKATYECLRTVLQATGDDERLIVAPLGSKPSAIGMALFSCCRENVRLKYDFPIRREGGTEGVGSIHRYLVERGA